MIIIITKRHGNAVFVAKQTTIAVIVHKYDKKVSYRQTNADEPNTLLKSDRYHVVLNPKSSHLLRYYNSKQ